MTKPQSSPTLAHVVADTQAADGWRLHSLYEHLNCVALIAAKNAEIFGSASWALLAGRWHDLGKYRPPFQAKIRKNSGFDPNAHIEDGGRANHSTAGALHAIECFKQRHGKSGEVAGRIFAYLIASHHAGLYDWFADEGTSLKERLAGEDARQEYAEALAAQPPSDILSDNDFNPLAELKQILNIEQSQPGAFALWVRMLFSSLVDADFLDTEQFMDPGKFATRCKFPDIPTLHTAYTAYMRSFGEPASTINRLRADVLAQCLQQAHSTPGAFSLTVPTGGGKTLASLGFALEHAVKHDKRRVIYAIPYTSIIEQTADVFRGVFADLPNDPVIEHHSQAESDGNTQASRLACENWDAPLIVTTNVQLFESLFAARTSHCRKLHNLANSVIVLDEAQQLPPEFLQPILDVLRLLIKYYGVSVVFCTATQPVLTSRSRFDRLQNLRGFDEGEVREIVSNPDMLFDSLKRVSVKLPLDLNTRSTWEDIAQDIAAEDCVLVIVNRKADARELWHRLPDGTIYLTTDLCGAHRAALLADIRKRLTERRSNLDCRPLRVVSTSLIEAGVDVDFPVVWRALAGLDSIAQAAGRCNREGKLPGLGRVVIFVPPKGEPHGSLQKAATATRTVLHGFDDPDGSLLLADRSRMSRYFQSYYGDCGGHDQKQIVSLLSKNVISKSDPLAVAFRTAAERFRLIDDEDQVTVYVRYPANDDEVEKWLNTLASGNVDRWLMRKLQRYAVTVRGKEALRMQKAGELYEVLPGCYRLKNDPRYHTALGLQTGDEAIFNAAGFSV